MTFTLDLLDTGKSPRRRITKSEFAAWQEQAVWHRLQNISLGRSFCDQFAIRDVFLMFCRDDHVIPHVKRNYLYRHSSG